MIQNLDEEGWKLEVEIPDSRRGTMAYIGTHVQGAAAAGGLNDTAGADADALDVEIALEMAEVDSAAAEYSYRIVPSLGYPGKDPTPNLKQVVRGAWYPLTETCSAHFLFVY
jgi:hypothetical protein